MNPRKTFSRIKPVKAFEGKGKKRKEVIVRRFRLSLVTGQAPVYGASRKGPVYPRKG